jgi:uncharacterized membrane protein
MDNPVMIVILRWLHIIPAAIVIGGLLFMRFILPGAIAQLPEAQREEVFLRARRTFKMFVHTSILLLVISGVINSIRFYPIYVERKPLAFALWHSHMFFAVIVFAISIFALAGKQPPPSHRVLGTVNIILLLLLVAASSTLQWVRTRSLTQSPPATTATG